MTAAVCTWDGAITAKYATSSTASGVSRQISRRRVVVRYHSLTTPDTPRAAAMNRGAVKCVR